MRLQLWRVRTPCLPLGLLDILYTSIYSTAQTSGGTPTLVADRSRFSTLDRAQTLRFKIMSKNITSKSGIPGRNKRGKRTTAAKKAKQRAQKRSDQAWSFPSGDIHKSDTAGKHEDAWMYEYVGPRDAAITDKSRKPH